MKPELISKVQGLFQKKPLTRYKGKKIRRGPYWFGWWMDNGKKTEVYIGKTLPPELEFLIEGRVKLPGRKRWSWPAYKMANRKST